MYTKASLDPEKCSFKANQKAINQWVANHVRQLGHYEDVSSPIINAHDEYMEEDFNPADTGREDRQETRTDLPLVGSGAQTIRATSSGTTTSSIAATTTASTTPARVTPLTGSTRLRFATPNPPTILLRANGGT
jgi:hypothetical protein